MRANFYMKNTANFPRIKTDRFYSITGDRKYFDFAESIVECGGTDVVNIFELAYENEFYPYQYPVTKAYEMTSYRESKSMLMRLKFRCIMRIWVL